MGFFSSVLIRLKGFFLQAGDDIVSGSTSSIKATYRTIEEQEIRFSASTGTAEQLAVGDAHSCAISATGTNIIDLDYCRSKGIAVTNLRDYASDSVA